MGIRFTDKSIKPILDVQESNSYDNTIAYEVNASSFDTTYISNRVLSYYIISIQGYETGEIEPLDCSVPITVNLYKIINNTQILYSSIKDEINYTREYKYVFIDKIFKETSSLSTIPLTKLK